MTGGFVISHRDKWNNPDFQDLLEAAIWQWMIETAAWEDTQVTHNKIKVSLKRGQLITTPRFIAKGFRISEKAANRIINRLIEGKQVGKQTTTKGSIITICNYDEITSFGKTEGVSKGVTEGNNKKEVKENKEKKENSLLSDFEEFWSLYPKKSGKKPAQEKYLQACRNVPHSEIMDGLRRYTESEKVANGFILNATTWLHQERWTDEPEVTKVTGQNAPGKLNYWEQTAKQHQEIRAYIEDKWPDEAEEI